MLMSFSLFLKIYPENEILKAKLELLSKTNMVDFAKEIHKRLFHKPPTHAVSHQLTFEHCRLYNTEEVPEEMDKRRDVIVGQFKALQVDVAPILRFIEQNQALVKQLRQDKQFTAQYLQENHGVSLLFLLFMLLCVLFVRGFDPRAPSSFHVQLLCLNLTSVTLSSSSVVFFFFFCGFWLFISEKR